MTTLMHLAATASASLLTAVWQSLILTLCVWLALRLLPAISAAWRSRLWLAVFFLSAALPFLHRSTSGSATPATASSFHLDARWALALLCTWAVFAAWSAFRLLRAALQLLRIVQSARPVAVPAQLQDIFPHTEAPALCVSAQVEVPSVAGFLRPRILLPVGLLETLSADDLRQIVLHELEHLRRRDDWTNLLQKLALVACPLNPVLLWLERRLCLERELACDDGVLRASNAGPAAGKAYATCLTNLAEQTMLRRGFAFALALSLGAWQRQSELARRIHRILLKPPAPDTHKQSIVAMCGLGAACTVAVLVLAHTPLTVSFDTAAPSALAATSTNAGTLLPPSPTAAHMTLLKATMPLAHVPHLHEAKASVGAASLRRAAMSRVAKRSHRQPLTPRITLISWSEDGILPDRNLSDHMATAPAVYFAPAAAPTFIFTYAAVPMRNGWLVIQL